MGYENKNWRALVIDLFTGASGGLECTKTGTLRRKEKICPHSNLTVHSGQAIFVILKELLAYRISGKALSEKFFDAAWDQMMYKTNRIH